MWGAVRAGMMVAVLVAAVAACGGGDQPVFGTAAGTSTTTSVTPDTGSSTSAGTAASTTTTSIATTTTAVPDDFAVIAAATEQATPGTPESEIDTPDFSASAAIAIDLAKQGFPVDDVGIWVLPVVGSDDRLLVVEVYPTADELEDTEVDLFAVLAGSQAIADSGVTRFVLHYFDTDDDGDFVFTLTMPFDALIRFVDEGAEVNDEVRVAQRRIEWSRP